MSLSFRPLRRSDFARLQKWLAEPHVDRWWNEPFDMASLETKYGPRIDGHQPTYMYLIKHEGAGIGWIQWYLWADYPEEAAKLGAEASAAGIDLAIGEVTMIGRGIGPAVIREFGTNYVFVNNGVSAIVTDPATANSRSVRAFEKAGYRVVQTDHERSVVRMDRAEMSSTG